MPKKPAKVIKKSTPIGGKKRGRPPKVKPQDNPPLVPASDWTAPSESSIDWSAETDRGIGANPITPPGSKLSSGNATNKAVLAGATDHTYKGLSQVAHGLSLTRFNPNEWFPTDLFKVSSGLERTTKEDADEAVAHIEEQRHTLRIGVANLHLAQDIGKAGIEDLKLENIAIKYAIAGENNRTEFVNYQTAQQNTNLAINRFDQVTERLTQGQKTLAGMRSMTPLIDQEWSQRRSLKNSQIKSLELAAITAKEALAPSLKQISEDFRTELDDLG